MRTLIAIVFQIAILATSGLVNSVGSMYQPYIEVPGPVEISYEYTIIYHGDPVVCDTIYRVK